MGRQLPWARGPSTGSVRSVSVQQHVTARNAQEVESAVEERLPGRQEQRSTWEPSTPRSRYTRVTSRSPSTSPPPPPGPPPISPLRPGYDNDDLYIMVEDEFWSVAQSYTAHLHHAEYKRLMRKAKEARPREVSDLSPSKPRDARDRARREVLRQKQHAALGQMVETQTSAMNNDKDTVVARKKDADPWRGTSLARLMRDNEQTKTSLVGLERLPSSTRAAKGYSKTMHESTQMNSRNDTSALDTRLHPRRTRIGYDDPLGLVRSLAVAEDEEDAFGRQHKLGMRKFRAQADTIESSKGQETTTSERGQKVIRSDLVKSKVKRSFLDDSEDDINDDLLDAPSISSHKAKITEKSTAKRVKDAKEDRRSRLDEVPFFMY